MSKRKFTSYPKYVRASHNTSSDEDLMAFGNTVPMEELFDKIREVTGIPGLEFSYNIRKYPYGNGIGITFESQDIADQSGFLNLMFKTLQIGSSNNQLFLDDDGVYTYWCIVDFSYNLQSGGRNGADFMKAWYTENSGWVFRLEKEKQ